MEAIIAIVEIESRVSGLGLYFNSSYHYTYDPARENINIVEKVGKKQINPEQPK